MTDKGEILKIYIYDNNFETYKKQTIKVENQIFTVLNNNRKGENNFDAEYHCDFCDPKKEKFSSKILIIPYSHLRICQNCICNMEEAIKASITYDCKQKRKGE